MNDIEARHEKMLGNKQRGMFVTILSPTDNVVLSGL